MHLPLAARSARVNNISPDVGKQLFLLVFLLLNK
jgi:hypothetical protein